MKLLFVTWDGPQVSYLEGLFLPIFKSLAETGCEFYVLQFSWGGDRRRQLSRQACEQAGITYRSVRVLRRPKSLGSLFTAIKGARDIRRAVRDWEIDVLVPRSTLPVLACLHALRGSHLPMVFDADGLPLDERVEFQGVSPFGKVYRFLRDVEAQGVRRAAVVLTRTEKASDILLSRAGAGISADRFYQVGNGRDSVRYAPLGSEKRRQARKRLGVSRDAPLLVYAGSLGPQYCMPEMLAVFASVLRRRSDARFLILTGSPDIAYPEIRRCGGLAERCVVRSVLPRDVPGYLACADVALALRRPSFSMQAVAPVKIGEYLLCGLPVIATVGVGDNSAISHKTGCLIDQSDDDSLAQAATWFTDVVLTARKDFRSYCREVGLERYSLESTVASYSEALARVLS